jgi:hypothetical protein
MDKTKLNNDAHTASIEKEREPIPQGGLYEGSFFNLGKRRLINLVFPMELIRRQPMKILKNLDWPMFMQTCGQGAKK